MFTLLSNLRLRTQWELSGISGICKYAESFAEFVRDLRNSDLVIVNGLEITLKLCALFIVAPWLRRPLIAVDLVLRKPETLKGRCAAFLIRSLLRNVHYFLHYFRDLKGYEKHFEIGPTRSGYVPFKPNLRYRIEAQPDAEGEYVLCLGYSMRDYETFFDAVATLGYPAAIALPNSAELRRHRSRFTRSLSKVPANVRVLSDDGSQESLVCLIRGARLVVLPILKSSLCAAGIGIYLNSMHLGKCVVISHGPGASDVLTEQALLFEPEDAIALAGAIRCAWEDDNLRRKTAASGHAYAVALGGEPELCERILTSSLQWYARQTCSGQRRRSSWDRSEPHIRRLQT